MYKALYRKWRPMSFDDVIAQPHITTTLRNQIMNNKTAHAYIFTGSRGTGKTTCARIFAKAVNCLNSTDGNPCLECDICRDAENEALADIIEIDAASNTGVDDMRDLRDGAIYSPERCRYKIYIIDEVHMLSTNAFNALLKIIEEPPPYVKFILATTEVHKVLPTILSRCQRFDFRRIMPEDIAARLKYIAGEEKITLTDDAASLIARIADGGMRDALSLLDQCIAYSENVDIDTVSAAAGIAGREYLFDIIDAIADLDAGKVLSVVDNLYSMSKDMSRLCEELILQFRNLMIIKSAPDKTGLISCLPNELERLKAVSAKLSLEEILDKLNGLQECNERLTRSLSKRVEFEMCLIKLCTRRGVQATAPQAQYSAPTPSATVQNTPAATPTPSAPPKAEVPTPKAVDAPPKTQANGNTAAKKPISMSDFSLCTQWVDILYELSQTNPAVTGSLTDSCAYVNDTAGLLLIIAKNRLFLSLFKMEKNQNSLNAAICQVLGRTYEVRAKAEDNSQQDGSTSSGNSPADEIISRAKENGIAVEIE
ncbi:MAG: DNA polymerase III subunit gamma/tau [Ruminococcus sp.]|nr:DNA polymerase III subunit gamma/tau [Ruminococcus sp.]